MCEIIYSVTVSFSGAAVEQQETDTMAEVVDNSEDQCTPSTDTANDMCVAEDCDAATPLRDIHQRRLLESRIVELERQLQAEKLRTQAQSQMIMKLEEKMSEIKVTTLSLANIMGTEDFLFYTGLPNYFVFKNLYGMIVTREPKLCSGNYVRVHTGEEQLFMVLVRLRTGMSLKEISRNFGISMSTFSRLFTSWIVVLSRELSALNCFPKLGLAQQRMPRHFDAFPDTRVVLDATEIRIQTPSSLDAQRQTFSPYKHANTMKCLVGVTPDCYVCYLSPLYGGAMSDREIVRQCGILNLLEPGEAVMVDKGFKIGDLLPHGVKLHIPPFRVPHTRQMPKSEVYETRNIAGARVHVERVIRRIKEFHIFDRALLLTMIDLADEIFTTCALLCNFRGPLIKEEEENEPCA